MRPGETRIRGRVALARQLQDFFEKAFVPLSAWKPKYEHDEEGKPIYDDYRLEGELAWFGELFDLIVVAPSGDEEEGEVKRNEPLGRLAVRRKRDGLMVRGTLDQSTWTLATFLINGCKNAAHP